VDVIKLFQITAAPPSVFAGFLHDLCANTQNTTGMEEIFEIFDF